MSAYRCPPARRADIGLGAGGILSIAQMVRIGRHHLDQRHAKVGHLPVAPFGHQLRHAVQHLRAETVKILGQKVAIQRRIHGRRRVIHAAIEIRHAIQPKAKVDLRQHPVEPRMRAAQRIGRKITDPVQRQRHQSGRRGHQSGHLNAPDPITAVDHEIRRRKHRRRARHAPRRIARCLAHQMHLDLQSSAVDLDIVDAVHPRIGARPQRFAPLIQKGFRACHVTTPSPRSGFAGCRFP